jgi:dienelactone hydrolase
MPKIQLSNFLVWINMTKKNIPVRWLANYSALTFALLLLSTPAHIVSAQDNIQVLTWFKFTDARNSLYHHISNEAYNLLEGRKERVSQVKTAAQWQERQQEIKQTMWNIIGPFPQKTPLNARITGRLKKKGFSVENLIYESLPGFYVTASLFIPDNASKPAPAILFCSGHSTDAYRKESYQLPLLNLVKKGFIVLAIDPLGQGERLQYFNSETGVSDVGSSTKEHSYPSVQVALIGQSIARYFIWDGIRGIDYLISRKEVDPERIGVHGLSGGGTQTAYISALDDRVAASAPACYITGYRRLMESIGVQDGEQNLYHGIARGIDHTDFVVARAPKPTLIMATTGDFFNIQGVYESYSEIKKTYDILGKPENIKLVEDDYGHGYTRKNREAMYAFFQEYLNLPGHIQEEPVEYLTGEELQKTVTGQLSTSIKNAETVFTLNKKEAEKYLDRLQLARQNPKQHLKNVVASAKQLSGFTEPSLSDKPVFTGRMIKDHFTIESYFIKGEGDYAVPFLIYIPERTNGSGIIYLHPEGKNAVNENEIKRYIEQGFTLLIPDLAGTGELGNSSLRGDAYINNVSYNLLFSALLIGRSIVGIQTADVIKLSRQLKQRKTIKDVQGISIENMSPTLLHAAAFDSVISQVTLVRPYASYQSFLDNRFYDTNLVHSLVPGALTAYDLVDLAATIAPRKLVIADLRDANGEKVKELGKNFSVVMDAYNNYRAKEQLKIQPSIN